MPNASLTIDGTEVIKKENGEIYLNNTNFIPTNPFTFRNRIINGNFDIWQRGTSPFTSTSVNEWSADRFRTEGYGLSTTISQQSFTGNQTDVPEYPTYYCRVATSAAPSAGQYWAFQQRIEAPQNISYGTYTLSFWVRCTSGSLSAGAFKYGINTASQSSPALSTTWTQLKQTFTISSFSGSNYVSIYLIYLTSSSPSSLSIDIAQVQVEQGTVATPFEHRPYGLELSLCQRYYEKSFEGATASFTDATCMFMSTNRTDRFSISTTINFLVEKRTNSYTLTIRSPYTNTANEIYDAGVAADRTVGNTYKNRKYFTIGDLAVAETTSANAQHQLHWEVNAEL